MKCKIFLMVAWSAVTLFSSIPAPAGSDLTVEPACGGRGITGVLRDEKGGSVIHFMSCETDYGAKAVIATGELDPMTVLTFDAATEDVHYWVNGVDLAGPLTEFEVEVSGGLFRRPETQTVARLIPALLDEGLDVGSMPMRVLRANLVVYEGRIDGAIPAPCRQDCDCLGCCGLGCQGCINCWTFECLVHDVCVRENGGGPSAHAWCFQHLRAAVLSIIQYC